MFDIFQVSNLILYIWCGVVFFLFSFKIVLHLLGCGKAKQFANAKKEHKFAVLIPARNESKVIGQLLDSIKKQNYSQKKLDIYVIVESLQDPTCEICKNFKNVEVFVRQHLERKGKGFALDECFAKIFKSQKHYDAFFVFDADNVLDKNFINEMNKCFDAGYEVACGYRNNKNWNGSWVSACSGLIFTVFSSFKNKSRAKMSMGIQVTGTGFYVSSKIIEEHGGWKYNTLTEDFEFTLASILNNYKSTYNENAMFYDEQPKELKVSWRQRVRWCKGFNQAGRVYNGVMLKQAVMPKTKAKKTLDILDFALAIVPIAFIAILVVVYSLFNLALFLIQLFKNGTFWVWPLVASLGMIFGFYLFLVCYTAFIFIVERKRIKIKFKNAVVACLMNPIFVCLYVPIFLQAAFSKSVEWLPIEHSQIMEE